MQRFIVTYEYNGYLSNEAFFTYKSAKHFLDLINDADIYELDFQDRDGRVWCLEDEAGLCDTPDAVMNTVFELGEV